MDNARKECIKCIEENIRVIKLLSDPLSTDDLYNLYIKIDHILDFYGFTRTDMKSLLHSKSFNPDSYSDEKLLELEGITNAMLFQLKYKL